jgi:hypothetical protein
MNKENAELIYWALKDTNNFYTLFDQDRSDYDEIKRARVKISNRYRELKSTMGFQESEHKAVTEWLMELSNDTI